MRRSTRQFLKFTKRLDEEYEKTLDLFFRQRPFLEDKTLKPVIREEMTDDEIEDKITNEFTIEELTKKIKEFADL